MRSRIEKRDNRFGYRLNTNFIKDMLQCKLISEYRYSVKKKGLNSERQNVNGRPVHYNTGFKDNKIHKSTLT